MRVEENDKPSKGDGMLACWHEQPQGSRATVWAKCRAARARSRPSGTSESVAVGKRPQERRPESQNATTWDWGLGFHVHPGVQHFLLARSLQSKEGVHDIAWENGS